MKEFREFENEYENFCSDVMFGLNDVPEFFVPRFKRLVAEARLEEYIQRTYYFEGFNCHDDCEDACSNCMEFTQFRERIYRCLSRIIDGKTVDAVAEIYSINRDMLHDIYLKAKNLGLVRLEVM